MILCGHDFNFSSMDADDLERMFTAQEHQNAVAERTKGKYELYTPDWFRVQCRIFMDYMDEVLGEGASELLGLNGHNWNKCQTVAMEFRAAIEAERAASAAALKQNLPVPQDRAQRRKQKKHKPHNRSEGFHPAVTVSPKPLEAADKAARRAELMRELAALDND